MTPTQPKAWQKLNALSSALKKSKKGEKESQRTRSRPKRQFSLSNNAYNKLKALANSQSGNMSNTVEKLILGK